MEILINKSFWGEQERSMNPAIIQFQTDNPDIRLIKGINIQHIFPCHIHNSYSLGMIQRGQRIVQVDGEPHTVSANECFIINPNQPHSCRIDAQGGQDYCVISISPRLFYEIFREMFGKDGFPYFSQVRIPDPLIVARLANWLEKQSPKKLTDEQEFNNILRELILRYADLEISMQPKHIRRLVVTIACEYIEMNSNRMIHMDEIANMAHISPFYLNRMFREEIGVPPYAYLLQTRIKKSLNFLLRTNSIAQTSCFMGFSDQSHFTRFFKRDIGVTPKRFLDLNKN